MLLTGIWTEGALNSDLLAETPQKGPKDDLIIDTPCFKKYRFNASESPCQRKIRKSDEAMELGLGNHHKEDDHDEFVPRVLQFM